MDEIYTFECYGVNVEGRDLVEFAQDPFPLEQNCDYLRLCKRGEFGMEFWYDDGTQKFERARAFETIYIGSDKMEVDIKSAEEPFAHIKIRLKSSDLLRVLEKNFELDRAVSFDEWAAKRS